MTPEEIREKYLNCVEPRIKTAAKKNANDPIFDKLYDLCNISSINAYEMFYPISDAFSSGPMPFDGLCELYHLMRYCWDDDGMLSFVTTEVSAKNRFYNSTTISTINFVMSSDPDSLLEEDVAKHAFKHIHSFVRLASYTACLFTEKDLDFLYRLIPEWKRIEMAADSETCKAGDDYFKMSHNMEQRIKQHIINAERSFKYKGKNGNRNNIL